jgi:hypothetical protein
MRKIELFSTDYVLWDKANDNLVCFGDGQVVIFGDKEEAEQDCRGNEYVVSCTELPMHHQEKLLNQIKNNN